MSVVVYIFFIVSLFSSVTSGSLSPRRGVGTELIKLYRTIILPVVLYGCEHWSLMLREECRLRVFENRVLRRIFGPKRAR